MTRSDQARLPIESANQGADDAALRVPPRTPTFATRIKMTLFRALERASELRAGLRHDSASGSRVGSAVGTGLAPGALWVFVSTIGELNAIEPFLTLLLADLRPETLVLLTDRKIYRESFLAKYPRAFVYELDGTSRDLVQLMHAAPPRLVVLGEIPCLLFDAPCRLSFGAIYELKRRGVPVCLVNGWLYGQEPSSNLDRIEKTLFGRDYVSLLDLITVQNEEVRRTLVQYGADPARVIVTGNIKFDAMTPEHWTAHGKRSEHLLRSIVRGSRLCIVAGSVTDLADQRDVLKAFKHVSARLPSAFLILAPRHPEQKDRMATLKQYCVDAGYAVAFRTRLGDVALPDGTQVLILDTIGELRDYYSVATIAHVGRNHNLVEPLAYGKPVTTMGFWEPHHPAYPVYRLLVETGAVAELNSADQLGAEWLRMLSSRGLRATIGQESQAVLKELAGASARNLALLRRHLDLRRDVGGSPGL